MTQRIDDEYLKAAMDRITQWAKSGGPEDMAIWHELQTFYDLGFRHGYEAGIERRRFVVYTVPVADEDGIGTHDELVRIPVEEAIENQRESLRLQNERHGTNHEYESDEQALEDFLTIHWAEVVEEE